MLSGLRFLVEQSRGRRFPEPEHPYRDLFQRDRDRIVHARAFRRLEAKTQVFPRSVSDHFRNRLTHTIEVSQIARTVAAVLGINQDLTEALALVHDIGHPPFAHAGEDALRLQMERFGGTFDHNLHALRIVDHFEQRYTRFPGLNLSFEVREGIIKHSRDIEVPAPPGLEEFLPGQMPPLEAQLIDLADEIAYDTADLDDSFSAGFFDLEDIAAASPHFAGILEAVQTQFPGADAHDQFNECLRRLVDYLVSGLLEGIIEGAKRSSVRTVADIRQQPGRIAAFTSGTRLCCQELKSFLHDRVYGSAVLIAERQRSAAMIATVFEAFMADAKLLPKNYQTRVETEPAHEVVCDYVAAMTDRYLIRTWSQLTGREA